MTHESLQRSTIPWLRRSWLIRWVFAGAGALAVAGCTNVPVYQQELVSKPGMIFSDSLVDAPRVNLLSQIEAGAAVSGGAQAAGCTACR